MAKRTVAELDAEIGKLNKERDENKRRLTVLVQERDSLIAMQSAKAKVAKMSQAEIEAVKALLK